MEITPEIKAQLEEQKAQCIFCKILSGEMESKKVYEDKFTWAILDINPCTKGHVLLMPKEHYPILPYLPANEFRQMFGIIPKLVNCIKKAMLATGSIVFIANGGVAGQQSPHFLIHMFPRELGDRLDKYDFNKKFQIDEKKAAESNSMLKANLSIMMQNHFKRNPAEWHKGNIKIPDYLNYLKKEQVLYADEKSICIIPDNPQMIGHVQIFSTEEKSLIENLDIESASHLFFLASFAATAVFEGIGAHGTNIILKSGLSKDNPEERLSIHILPRYQEDGLDIMPIPSENKPDLDEIKSRIRDQTIFVEHEQKPEKKPYVLNLDEQENKEKIKEKNSMDEVIEAIRKVKE